MKIKSISIEYIKGIKDKTFELDLYPNKPNIFVAPNGFGKSSFTTAFKVLNKNKINLVEKEDFYENNDQNNNNSNIKIIIEDENKETKELIATNEKNEIGKTFDIFIINSSFLVKAKSQNFGAFHTTGKASLRINDIVLKRTIPKKINFEYKSSKEKQDFGVNSKILENLESKLKNNKFIVDIFSHKDFKKIDNKINSEKIKTWVEDINLLKGTKEEVVGSIDSSLVNKIFDSLKTVVKDYFPQINDLDSYLLIYQLHNLKDKNLNNILNYRKYLVFKERTEKLLESLGATWKSIKPKETKKKLVLEFPDIRNISNGQRDSISFFSKFIINRGKDK